MADVAAQPFINYGASIAGQENTAANTALTNQQVAQQSMNTQIQRATMPMIMRTIQESMQDQSGANPGNPDAGLGQTQGGVPGAAMSRADQSGVDNFYTSDHAGRLEDMLRQQNYVQPYTAQELQMLKYGTALSLNPNTAEAGKAIVDRMKVQQAARVANQTAANQLAMGNTYDTAASVATIGGDAGTGAFKALLAADPADARAINPEAAAGRAEPTELDDLKAKKYAGHLASVSFLYSGRPHELQNGQMIDTASGKPVTGQDQIFTGLTPEQLQKEWDAALKPTDWTDKDGVKHTDPLWRVPVAYGGYGGMTPGQAVLAADQAARHKPGAAPGQPPGIIPNAAASVPPGSPPSNGATAATRVNAKQNAKPPTTGADVAAGKAPATGADTGTLPGVNPASLPKMVSPVANQGPGTAGTVGTKLQESLAARNDEEIKSAKSAYTDAQTMRSQINQAKAQIANIDPRTVGPGSTIYNDILKTVTALAGEAPDALVKETVLDKFLNQIGASNVRNLLAGQRITNQEMMTFLTRGSPSTAMPLGGIQHLLNYLDADNEYTLRYNRTKMMGLKSGADPDLIDQELSSRVRRADFVMNKTGSADAIGANAQHPDITQAAYAQLKTGEPFYWKGALHHKDVD